METIAEPLHYRHIFLPFPPFVYFNFYSKFLKQFQHYTCKKQQISEKRSDTYQFMFLRIFSNFLGAFATQIFSKLRKNDQKRKTTIKILSYGRTGT
jgi:hypothetical protein